MTSAIHVWQIPGRPDGDVRLLTPGAGKRSYRIVWREGGRQHERTTTDLERAMMLGMDQATVLAAEPGQPGPRAPFRDALSYHLDAAGRGVTWAVKYQRRLAGLVRRWMDDDLLDLPCLAFEPPAGRIVVVGLLGRLDTAGYPLGSHEYEQMGALLSGTFRSGISAGFFAESPMVGVAYSVAAVHRHDPGERFTTVQPVPEEECPPTWQIDRLLGAFPTRHGRWWESLPAAVMAYGGLRIEEALALEPDHVLAGSPGLLVNQQVCEIRRAENGGIGDMRLTLPKGGRARETFVKPEVWELLQRRAAEVVAMSPSTGRPRPMFPARRGGWQRVDNYRARIFVPAARAVGWPKRADADQGHRTWLWTPHSLRHHYANWTLKDLHLPPTVVAGYLGHVSADITERMYLHRERSDINRGLTAYQERATA